MNYVMSIHFSILDIPSFLIRQYLGKGEERTLPLSSKLNIIPGFATTDKQEWNACNVNIVSSCSVSSKYF